MHENEYFFSAMGSSVFQDDDFVEDELIRRFSQMKIQELPKFEPHFNQNSKRVAHQGQPCRISCGNMDLYDDLFVSRKIPRDIVFREKEEFQNDGVFAEEEETNNEYGENVEGNE